MASPYSFAKKDIIEDMALGMNPNKSNLEVSNQNQTRSNESEEEYIRNQAMKKIFATPRELLSRVESVKALPEYADSISAQTENERMMKTLANMELPESFGGAKQLLALADSETGSKLLGGYSQPSAMDDYVKTMSAYQQAQNKQKQDRYADLIKAAGGVEAGYDTGIIGRKTGSGVTNTDTDSKKSGVGTAPPRASGAGKTYDPTKDLEKHQKRMEKIQPLITSIQSLSDELGGIGSLDEKSKKDIPGIGKTKMLPGFMLSNKGSAIQQKFGSIRDSILHAKSGAAITPQEADRLLATIGGRTLDTDREFVLAIKNLRKEMSAIMKQKEAAIKAVRPEIISLYKEGGGVDSSGFEQSTMGSSENKSSGSLDPAKAKRLEELRKKLGK